MAIRYNNAKIGIKKSFKFISGPSKCRRRLSEILLNNISFHSANAVTVDKVAKSYLHSFGKSY